MLGPRSDSKLRVCLLAAGVALSASSALAQDEALRALSPEAPPPQEPWYDALELRAFADVYASLNYNFPKPQRDANVLRAFDQNAGFSLSWVGGDVSYQPAPVGGKLSLRFGPTAERLAGPDAEHHLEFVKEAFASWSPFPSGVLRLDLGKFDTIYGLEVAESQDNPNYSRSFLYWLGQPAFHTGLRARIAPSDHVAFNVLAVNGWNRSVDNNIGKTFGAQLDYTPTHRFGLRLGWIGGPEQDDTLRIVCPAGQAYDPDVAGCAPSVNANPNEPNASLVDRGGADDFENWRHLLDLTATFAPHEQLWFGLNASWGWERRRVDDLEPSGATEGSTLTEDDVTWYGVALGARFELTPIWALAARGEYFGDPDGGILGARDGALVEGTLTLEANLEDHVILRLEQRGDFAVGDDSQGRDIFPRELREHTSHQLTTTLGVVVTTN